MSDQQPYPRSVNELRMREIVCDKIIHYLADECADDDRQSGALEHYRRQYKTIHKELILAEKLERQKLGIPEPEPVVVNLKPARLFAKSEGVK